MLKAAIKKAMSSLGYSVERQGVASEQRIMATLSPIEHEIWEFVRPYTMTSIERVLAVIDATRYVLARGIPGAIVECGVWRGGSVMAVGKTLLSEGCRDRELYLFDTFEGMPKPATEQMDFLGRDAGALLDEAERQPVSTQLNDSIVAWSPLSDVRKNVESTHYPADRCHYIKGRVEDTLPHQAPDQIALLRIDTDWYESTKAELTHLFPRLATGGVLIVDDYGHWQGARKAVDEYLVEHRINLLLNRVDYTGRIAVKT
jgi:hypothetical protein